jgi:hypothetical protein
MPERNTRPIVDRPYHWLNNFGEAICKSPEKRGSGEALAVFDHDEACLNCVRIVSKMHASTLRWR